MEEYLRLDVKNYNNFKSNDYILNDYVLADESLLKLAELLGIEEEFEEDRIEKANEWFDENSFMNYDLTADKFYNETISRKDIHVYGTIEISATYKNTEIYAIINIDCEEMYNVHEAIDLAEEQENN